MSCYQQDIPETSYESKSWSVTKEIIVVLLGEKKLTHIMTLKPIHSALHSESQRVVKLHFKNGHVWSFRKAVL